MGSLLSHSRRDGESSGQNGQNEGFTFRSLHQNDVIGVSTSPLEGAGVSHSRHPEARWEGEGEGVSMSSAPAGRHIAATLQVFITLKPRVE